GGEAVLERLAVHHDDPPVDDVGKAGAASAEDGADVLERPAGLGGEIVPDDLAVRVDAVLPAHVDRGRRRVDHDALAERRVAGEAFGVEVLNGHGGFYHRPADTAGPQCAHTFSLSTLAAFSRRNLGITSSRRGTSFISVMMRSSDRPIGK